MGALAYFPVFTPAPLLVQRSTEGWEVDAQGAHVFHLSSMYLSALSSQHHGQWLEIGDNPEVRPAKDWSTLYINTRAHGTTKKHDRSEPGPNVSHLGIERLTFPRSLGHYQSPFFSTNNVSSMTSTSTLYNVPFPSRVSTLRKPHDTPCLLQARNMCHDDDPP
ncbi:hypothetical protein ACRALDRAFT_207241 [Sodiomyces alcalophilus JCM 7366]|uniref:uncharacterized protein n=1 Tax=Sodiomyces alcalophilus JCM 7366 TaxID=591952 RepID=UPI0039B4D592